MTHTLGFSSPCIAALDTASFPFAFLLAIALDAAFVDLWNSKVREQPQMRNRCERIKVGVDVKSWKAEARGSGRGFSALITAPQS